MRTAGAQSLRELQTQMAAAVMLPLTPSDRIARRRPAALAAAAFIKPNSRLTSFERLEIYSRSYWFRLLDSLREDFPGLLAVLGAPAFERMAKAYLEDCPSQSFTLRDLGSRLEEWLRAHPRHARPNRLLALDMARLEWAHIVAFDGPAEPVPHPKQLENIDPDLCLGIQPYITVLDLQYPVDELRVGVDASSEACQRMVRQLAESRPTPIYLAVHRVDLNVYYRRLTPEEFTLLNALRAGHTIGQAIGTAFEHSPVAADAIPNLLRTWFTTWAQFGWLCAARNKRKKS